MLKDGSLIQLWAFLREANRTAFEMLRTQSFFLNRIRQDILKIDMILSNLRNRHENSINQHSYREIVTNLQSGGSSLSCVEPKELNQRLNDLVKLLEQSISAFKQSFLLRDIPNVPGEDLHIHLARLFFLKVDSQYQNLTQRMNLSEIISDVALLDHRRKAKKCHISYRGSSEPQIDADLMENVPKLQNLLFHTNDRFTQLKNACQRLVRENIDLIDSLSIKIRPDPLVDNNPSTFFEDRFVTLTVKMSRDRNKILRLESVQNLYSPFIELTEIIMSGAMLTFVLIFLCGCYMKTKPMNEVSQIDRAIPIAPMVPSPMRWIQTHKHNSQSTTASCEDYRIHTVANPNGTLRLPRSMISREPRHDSFVITSEGNLTLE
ncbi:hypothetical protein Ciccas_001318 [Cichlidogyrus casuarinus]|uniref:Envelope protein n=1 Tax=Cichlidogyrus casuarinus TaxID=1844966 RepID=A0ABD2QMM7_9PLAT